MWQSGTLVHSFKGNVSDESSFWPPAVYINLTQASILKLEQIQLFGCAVLDGTNAPLSPFKIKEHHSVSPISQEDIKFVTSQMIILRTMR